MPGETQGNNRRKRVVKTLFILAILTFICGAAARIIVQVSGAMWLDGIVGIMGGLYASLLAAALIYSIATIPRDTLRLKFYILSIPLSILGLAVFLFGLFMIFVGASRLVASLP
jgi:hypothetical protein